MPGGLSSIVRIEKIAFRRPHTLTPGFYVAREDLSNHLPPASTRVPTAVAQVESADGRGVTVVACVIDVGLVYNTPTNNSGYPSYCTTRKRSAVPASDPLT